MTNRNHQLEVKLTTEELEKIKGKAELLGVKPSVYLRMIGLSAKIEVESG